ncbi:MAG: penicillin-binding protein 2 [Gammaproteobacteria bacterium]
MSSFLNKKPKNINEVSRIIIFLSPFAILLIFALVQIINLTLIKGEDFKTQADSNRIYQSKIYPKRGFIFDTNNILLAENIIQQDLKITLEYVEEIDLILTKISNVLDIDYKILEKNFFLRFSKDNPLEPFTLIKNLTEEQIAKISVNLSELPGTEIEASFSRNVVHDEISAPVIGYVGNISKEDISKNLKLKKFTNQQVGKAGIERDFDPILRGKIGFRVQERDSKGQLIKNISIDPPENGRDLRLSIDINLQKKLYKEFKGRKGALVAIEPKTGLIRALISSPSYDPNLLNTINNIGKVKQLFSDQNSPLFNRAIAGQYPPASTLKPFVGLAALEANSITWDAEIIDSGEYYVEGDERPYKGWKDGGHGIVNMKKAIVESSDVYFYSLAYDLTIGNLSPFLQKFGFGSTSGLTQNESKGVLPSKKWKLGYVGDFWFKGDTINMGIGQGYISATPIQIAVAYSVLANKGELIQPRIIESIGNNETLKISKELIQISDKKNWDRIESALIGVVEASNGTAQNIFKNNIRIAGKTGTAQVKSINDKEYELIRENEALRDHALFVGYGPVKNPSLTVVAIIENGESGSAVAAPLVRSAIDYYVDNYEK